MFYAVLKKSAYGLMSVSVMLLSGCHATQPKDPRILHEVDVIRHGARTTLHPLKGVNYPAIWDNGNTKPANYNIPQGQLTYFGMQEAMLFAKGVRQSNASHGSFLPSTYTASRVCVRTTGINRTLMSAVSALTGLYPSLTQTIENNHTVVLHSVAFQNDELLLPQAVAAVKPQLVAPLKALAASRVWKQRWHSADGYALYKQLHDINSGFFPQGSALCAKNISDPSGYQQCLAAIIPLADNVQTLQDYCAHSQCSVSSVLKNLTPQLQKKVLTAYAWYAIHSMLPTQAFARSRASYKKIALATGAKLVSVIAQNMLQYSKNSATKKYILYSGHDTTDFDVLSYLLIQSGQNAGGIIQAYPGFVANVSFQLYKNAEQHFMVKAVYYKSYQARLHEHGKVIVDMPLKTFYHTFFNAKAYHSVRKEHVMCG